MLVGHFVCRVPWSRCAPPQAAGTAPRRAPPPAVGPPRLLGRACRPRCRLTAKACAVHLAVSETPCLHPSVFSPCARGHADEQKKMQRAVTPPFRLCPFLVLTARKRGRATWPTRSGPCGSRGGRAPRRRGARGRAACHLAVPCPWDACRYPQHRVPSASIRLLCGAFSVRNLSLRACPSVWLVASFGHQSSVHPPRLFPEPSALHVTRRKGSPTQDVIHLLFPFRLVRFPT